MPHTTRKLEPAELDYLEVVAAMRQAANRNRRNRPGTPAGNDRDMHYLGAAGEYVAALYFDVSWRPLCDPWQAGHGDIANTPNVQVRTTTYRGANPHLLAYRADPHPCIYVLVVQHTSDTFEVAGVTTSFKAREAFYWRDNWERGNGAYWVPRTALDTAPDDMFDTVFSAGSFPTLKTSTVEVR